MLIGLEAEEPNGVPEEDSEDEEGKEKGRKKVEIYTSKFELDVLRQLKQRARPYGCEVLTFDITNFSKPEKVIRFVGGGVSGYDEGED